MDPLATMWAVICLAAFALGIVFGWQLNAYRFERANEFRVAATQQTFRQLKDAVMNIVDAVR